MTRLRVAVVGVGHLGKEHARILASLPGVELAGVADANAAQAQAVAARCHTAAYTDHRPLLAAAGAAVIAVPTAFHRDIARERERLPHAVEPMYESIFPRPLLPRPQYHTRAVE